MEEPQPVAVTVENAMTVGEDDIRMDSASNHQFDEDRCKQKGPWTVRNVQGKKKRVDSRLEHQDLIMIKAIKARPGIWHPRHKDGSKIKLRRLFDEVSAICKIPVDVVRSRWRDKRDSFIKWHRKLKTSNENLTLSKIMSKPCSPKLVKRTCQMYGRNCPSVPSEKSTLAVRCVMEQNLSYRKAAAKWYNVMKFLEPFARDKSLEDYAIESVHLSDEGANSQDEYCDPLRTIDPTQESERWEEGASKDNTISTITGSPTVKTITQRLVDTSEQPEVQILKIVNRQRPILPKPAKFTKPIECGGPNQSNSTWKDQSNPSEDAMSANGNKMATIPCRVAVMPQRVDPLASVVRTTFHVKSHGQ